MKTSYFLIITMSIFVISLALTTGASAQNDSTFKYDPTLQYGSKPQTPTETPEQLHKKLVNARDAISNIMGSKMGNIPFNEVGVDEINSTLDVGIDSSKATLSEEQYLKKIKEIVGDIPIKITFGEIQALPLILTNNSTHGNDIATPILSPLKQFKSGVSTLSVKCGVNFSLVIKSEDGSPACVKPDTAQRLIERGWAKEIISQIETQASIKSSTEVIAPCQTPFEKNTAIIQVLYMPMDSTGMICIQYSNQNQNPVPVGIQILESKNLTHQASDITIHANATSIISGNSTVVYTVQTGPQAGFYQLSVFCSGMPFAVGYDNQSRIVADDFPWLYQTVYCPLSPYNFKVIGVSGTGITNLK